MDYKLEISPRIYKFLKQLKSFEQIKIIQKIEKLQLNPFPSDSKRLVNTKLKVYRVRSGNYRILYYIKDKQLIIVFLINTRE
ncbi:MAG: type II toxin-antitoxin system RelE/ParE family toxin [Nanoarchaeales archaeon]|nr:type II toxin-antitoxin system RelE/ParE family toxin [Nanoarchaeales archaeon]